MKEIPALPAILVGIGILLLVVGLGVTGISLNRTIKGWARIETKVEQLQTPFAEFTRKLTLVEDRLSEIHYRDTNALAECAMESGKLKRRLEIIQEGVLKSSRRRH